MRKNIHTLTMRLKPKEIAMYNITIGLNPTVAFVVVDSLGVFDWAFATCVPANAKNKNLDIIRTDPLDTQLGSYSQSRANPLSN